MAVTGPGGGRRSQTRCFSADVTASFDHGHHALSTVAWILDAIRSEIWASRCFVFVDAFQLQPHSCGKLLTAPAASSYEARYCDFVRMIGLDTVLC